MGMIRKTVPTGSRGGKSYCILAMIVNGKDERSEELSVIYRHTTHVVYINNLNPSKRSLCALWRRLNPSMRRSAQEQPVCGAGYEPSASQKSQ